ncbi:MAG TPA: hypothetical protein VK177_16625 [Flavobacteriales bacterium]|nr:hypothetical protein [Flavobacteriales bacterium]
MKATVAIYKSHRQAMEALKALERHFFSLNKVSVKGHTEIVEDHIHFETSRRKEFLPVILGIIIGPIIGMLVGTDTLMIPGLWALQGQGAFIGALAGLEVGVAIGGAISLIITVVKKKEDRYIDYEKHENPSEYQITVDGTREEIQRAEKILQEEEAEIIS